MSHDEHQKWKTQLSEIANVDTDVDADKIDRVGAYSRM
jgi:hypothetical protein